MESLSNAKENASSEMIIEGFAIKNDALPEKILLRTLLDRQWGEAVTLFNKGFYKEGTKKNTFTKYQNIISFMASHGYMDIEAINVGVRFGKELKRYLLVVAGCGDTHTNRIIQWLKGAIRTAVELEELETSKIECFRTHGNNDCKYNHIELHELDLMGQKRFRPALQIIVDLYMFCCYTGLGFSELNSFDPGLHLSKDEHGIEWITMSRQKNNVMKKVAPLFHLPLFPEARAILEKYDFKLPKRSLKTINKLLKEIAIICGISLNLTSHTARKTFGLVMLETYAFSMEALSYMLGHKTVRTTERYYARIRKQRVKKEYLAQKSQVTISVEKAIAIVLEKAIAMAA